MASSIDVSPALGHAVISTQLGVGSSPGYDAIDLRRVANVGLQEGVHDTGGWKVTEHSPNGMSIDVAGNVGIATVTGDTVSSQGNYVVSPHSSVANLTINTADATNPRIDQIILHAYDTTHDGLGSNKASMEVLTGTPTSGATLNNRNGATPLPNTALLLADVLVAAGTGTITNSNIRDRRKWANGAMWRGVSTAGNVTLATSASSPGPEILSSSLKARLEIGLTSLVLVEFAAWGSSTGGSAPVVEAGPLLDGATPEGSGTQIPNMVVIYETGSSGLDFNVNFAFVLSVSAGSHLFSVGASRVSGATLYANASTPAILTVKEMIGAGSANNGTS